MIPIRVGLELKIEGTKDALVSKTKEEGHRPDFYFSASASHVAQQLAAIIQTMNNHHT